ncbi:hypothetical protein DFH09DRAFT_1072488 [Mycena vulgaris]|nr:hypothetical protein DFH09DRAFT_1072488 [Mycena vulgaris]
MHLFATTGDEVATAFADEIKSRTVLITSTSLNVTGFETTRVVAKYANLVVITGYNDERSQKRPSKRMYTEANSQRLTLVSPRLRKAAAEFSSRPDAPRAPAPSVLSPAAVIIHLENSMIPLCMVAQFIFSESFFALPFQLSNKINTNSIH